MEKYINFYIRFKYLGNEIESEAHIRHKTDKAYKIRCSHICFGEDRWLPKSLVDKSWDNSKEVPVLVMPE